MSKLKSSCSRMLAAIFVFLPLSAHAVMISEVFYDAVGADDGYEWVELFNSSDAAIDLSGYRLGYGGSDYTYGSVSLSGTVASGDYFVIGGPSNPGLNFDMAHDFSPNIQNSGSVADGVALFSPLDQILDAVIYGGINSNHLLDSSGMIGVVDVGDAGAGSSIERVTVAGSWHIQSTPTPGSGPLQRAAELPEPSSFILMSLGAMMMATLMLCRRRLKRDCDERAISTYFTGNRLTA